MNMGIFFKDREINPNKGLSDVHLLAKEGEVHFITSA